VKLEISDIFFLFINEMATACLFPTCVKLFLLKNTDKKNCK